MWFGVDHVLILSGLFSLFNHVYIVVQQPVSNAKCNNFISSCDFDAYLFLVSQVVTAGEVLW